MIEPTPTPEETPESRSPQSQQILILSVIGGAVLLLAAVVIIVVLGLRGTDQTSDATPTPTESILPTPPPSSTAPPPSCETIISSGDVEVSIALPTLLTLKGTPFPVEPIVPEGDVWSYPADRSATAVWVCGTVINYVIGLEPTPENETLVTSLTPGDEVTLQLTSGAVLPFRFAGRGEVVAGDADALTQQQPRLTLVLTKGDTWQIATADYVAEAESIEPPPSGTLVQLGQPAQIGEAIVTVNRGHAERAENLPPDTMYYVVEYSVENRGAAPLTIDGYSMKLEDGVGNAYLLSPPGSEAGDFGPLSGEIAPGSSAQGSAGYLVPDPLPAGPLVWSFSSRVEPGAQASVSIPYESETGSEPSVEQAEVALTDAFFSSDGNTLILEGEVRNTGTETLNIEEGDIRLSSSAGPSDLFLAAPPLPWAIGPGQRQVIELQYQRPDASTVLLELLGYSFEIGGLQ